VKGAVPDRSVQLSEIFAGSIPYWILILIVLALVWLLPELATEPITWSSDIIFNHQIGFSFR
jgi:TRAP-type mannitol/chloroaromatic compound transport system permease large subunit